MSIIESYDESEEIVKAELFTKEQKRLPEVAIVCFKKELIDAVMTSDEWEEYSSILECGEEIKIFKYRREGNEVILYRTMIGGPATVLMMEELASRGVKKFIFFGSCGLLENNIATGAFILPTEAYRDEGTSYHYLPSSDFIKVETCEELSRVFEENHIPYVKTKTWTTDAIYRETKEKVAKRLSEGCKVVEMECASVMAVTKVRRLQSYYFLYSDDTLEGGNWDLKTLKEDRSYLLKECLKIAQMIANYTK